MSALLRSVRRATPRLAPALVGALLCAGGARAEVLYDTRGMAAAGTWDSAWLSVIGGMGQFGNLRDYQTADDFTLSNQTRLTSVTVDFLRLEDSAVPAGGFLVEFFEDVGERPADVATLSVSTSTFAVAGPFAAGAVAPYSTQSAGWRATFVIDLSPNNLVLPAGQWWIAVQAVDETPFGVRYAWIGQVMPPTQIGGPTHQRGGGVAHGNGYPGPGTSNWFIGPPSPLAVQQSFEIRGSTVSSDLDGDGSVGSGDLAIVLGAWGMCSRGSMCPADLDNDGMVGSGDLALVLGAWGSAR